MGRRLAPRPEERKKEWMTVPVHVKAKAPIPIHVEAKAPVHVKAKAPVPAWLTENNPDLVKIDGSKVGRLQIFPPDDLTEEQKAKRPYSMEGEVALGIGNALVSGELLAESLHDDSAAVISVDSENVVFVQSPTVPISETEQEMVEDLGYAMWFGWSNMHSFSYVDFLCELMDRKKGRKSGTYMKLYNDLKDRGLRLVFCVGD